MARIVWCEDSSLVQKMVEAALRPTAHDLYLAADGAEGLALVDRERPDLVFTDLSMPGMDGFALADALRARPDLAELPIVFVTAADDGPALNPGARYGRASLLLKPFSGAAVRAKVEEMLGSATPERSGAD